MTTEKQSELQKLQNLDLFCEERELAEDSVIEDFGDIVINVSGINMIYPNKYENLVHERGKKASRKQYKPKKDNKVKSSLENTNNPGLLIAHIPRKEKQIDKLSTEKANLEKSIDQEEDAIKKSQDTIRLKKITKDLKQAEYKLEIWKDRLDQLLNKGNIEHSEEE